ncbi:MAG: tRNA (adenosine(37)-N6)-threonylcarbamoyltransferase complex ATPase subunit type 1 TsaE [Patescibacteria group bacterium]
MKTAPLTISDTKNLAKNLLERIVEQTKERANFGLCRQALIIGLYGDLGSGKTTFMQFFGEALGVKEKILSPTFVIEKIYKIAHPNFDHLIHIDAYRLENADEMRNLGWANIIKNPRNLIAVEWADRIAELLPNNHICVNFSHHNEESRIITFKS